MNNIDRKFIKQVKEAVNSNDMEKALNILDAWQDIDTNEMTGGYIHSIYNNYGSGRSDR